ncbi:MAG: Mut7-C RNAse domain-containing protein [Syntrophales bacterium]
MKFITDTNLGKLAKWLRILGYDTVSYRGEADRNFLRKAEREGRVVLTRKKDMAARQFSGKLVIVENDNIQEQLVEVMEKLSISANPDQLFSICVRCNEALVAVEKENVAGLVPAFVYDTQSSFRRCPGCKGIFWPGTHIDNAINHLKTRILRHHP